MRALVLTAAALLFAACDAQPGAALVASNVVITRTVAPTGMSAAYLTLANTTKDTIRISRVTSAQFDAVMLHETTIENGIARMRAMAALEIRGGESVTLERGGKHLMLMQPNGSSDTVTLRFFDNERLILTVNARMEPADG